MVLYIADRVLTAIDAVVTVPEMVTPRLIARPPGLPPELEICILLPAVSPALVNVKKNSIS